MEGRRRVHQEPNQSNEQSHGRHADNPAEIPKRGWRDILLRTKEELSNDHVPVLAAASAFYLLLALIPGLAALISIYGFVADPGDIRNQFDAVAGIVPSDARKLLEDQMTSISGQHKAAGFAAAVSILAATWGASAGIKTLMVALNVVYGEEEKRSYIHQTLIALGLTVGSIVAGVVAVGLIVALPAVLAHVGLGDTAATIVGALRWPLLFAVAIVGLAVVYRYAPSREKPKWKWVSSGAVIATLLWLGGSVLFSFYASHFGSYNKTYGSLGAVVVLMMWLLISAFAVLLGAEINAESEHQTEKDSTTGAPKPIGRRGAYMADTIGEEK